MTAKRLPYPGLPDAYDPRVHRAEVVAVRRVSDGMVRIALGGPDMRDYPTTGIGDEYVRLFFPDTPAEPVRLPFLTESGWDYPEGVAPSAMRTYTIRAHREGAVDIDFATHEGGIAAAWALQARPGQELGINPPRPIYERPVWATRQLLIADEPALPAALRIAELTAGQVDTTIIAEVRGPGHQMLADADGVDYVWLRGTGNGHGPSELLPALRRTGLDERTYVWFGGEARVNREVRRLLRHDRALPAGAQTTLGYWTDRSEEWGARYEALGEDFHERIRLLYESDRDTEEVVDEVFRLYEAAGL
ncbi:NADPH-dependent ferric siderophore reductase [Microbacterium resistens]|uniref:NADPH-dependent ferric siderophore reductase n=1 Tax=Microbacterium resistens TaxID=156977 RepID=A0ABU1SDX3_9MICO|nr:siderophore-interacting protein [Microbacterium resistens]MDR6867769.1 NADPH-dependent ferric siderophore reductase [Microbacterium resistens]